MTTAPFDTLKLAQDLRARAGFEQNQAEGMAGAFAEAMQSELVTKADLTASSAVLKADIAAVRTDLKAEIATVRTELKADNIILEANLRAAISDGQTSTIKWVCGMIGFQAVAILGGAAALFSLIRH